MSAFALIFLYSLLYTYSFFKYRFMKIQKSKLYPILYALLAFAISLYVAPYYILGDQQHYRGLYKNCFFDSMSLEAQMYCYSQSIGSSEPVYFFLLKIVQPFFDKDLFVSIANALMMYLIARITFREYAVVWHRNLFMFFILSNYYIIVLMLAAERLKFAFIFLLLAAFCSKRIFKAVFIMLSLLCHTQMMILISSFLMKNVLYIKMALYKKIGLLVIGGFGMVAALFVLKDHIIGKYESISSVENITESPVYAVVKSSIFIIFAAISTRRIDPLIFGSPLILSAYFLGSSRIVIMTFLVYIVYVISIKKKMDILMFLSLAYCSYKSIGFIYNTIQNGSGYLSIP